MSYIWQSSKSKAKVALDETPSLTSIYHCMLSLHLHCHALQVYSRMQTLAIELMQIVMEKSIQHLATFSH